jgi:hypothetical protein
MGYNQQAVSNLPGEERFFSAIGRFVFEFSQLEYTLKLFISRVIGLKDKHFNALMSHDFALTCSIAQTVLARWLGFATVTLPMALTPAQKQRRYRERQAAAEIF